MSDDPNLSELLDDDKLSSPYPPDEPFGVTEDELTVRGGQTDEPLEERVAREEPDFPAARSIDDEVVGTLVEPEAGGPDLTKEAVASEIASDDPTAVGVATELGDELAAEEAAMHLADDPPIGKEGDGYV